MVKSKEAVFAVAAFGVLAYVVGKDIPLVFVIGAAVVSISLFLYHVLSFEQIGFYKDTAKERLKEIEMLLNKEMIKGNMRFQKEYLEYEKMARKGKRIRITILLRIMAGILISLWVVLIVVKICEFLCSLFL